MKFTLNWLLDHLDTDKSLDEIVDKLSMIGLEVENVSDKSRKLKDFIIAKVIDCKPHPNADRLKILSVDDKSGDTHQVICGAPNAKKDLIGVFAKPGMYIPGIDLKLEVGDIRGEKSFGMMSSERELENSDEHEEIIKLNKKLSLKTFYIGSEFRKLTKKNSFIDFQEFKNYLKDFPITNSTILIKGSRSQKLENIVELL